MSCSLGGAPPSLFLLNPHVLQLPPPPPITHSLQALLSSGLSNCTKKMLVFFPCSLLKEIVSVQNNIKQPMLQDHVRQHCTQQRSSCLQHTLTKGQQGQKNSVMPGTADISERKGRCQASLGMADLCSYPASWNFVHPSVNMSSCLYHEPHELSSCLPQSASIMLL